MSELIKKAIDANNKHLLSRSIASDTKGSVQKYNVLFLTTRDYVEELPVSADIGTVDESSFQSAMNTYNRLMQEWKIAKQQHDAEEDRQYQTSLKELRAGSRTGTYNKQPFRAPKPKKPKEHQFVTYLHETATIDISGVQTFTSVIINELKEIPTRKIDKFISDAEVVMDSDDEKHITKEHLNTLGNSFADRCQAKASDMLTREYKYIKNIRVSTGSSIEYETSIYPITKVSLSEKRAKKSGKEITKENSFFFDKNDNIIHMKTFKSVWKWALLYLFIGSILSVAGYYTWQYGSEFYEEYQINAQIKAEEETRIEAQNRAVPTTQTTDQTNSSLQEVTADNQTEEVDNSTVPIIDTLAITSEIEPLKNSEEVDNFTVTIIDTLTITSEIELLKNSIDSLKTEVLNVDNIDARRIEKRRIRRKLEDKIESLTIKVDSLNQQL